MRVAIVTLVVPIKPCYPWKDRQPQLEQALINAAATAVQWLDCVDGPVTATVAETRVKEWKA